MNVETLPTALQTARNGQPAAHEKRIAYWLFAAAAFAAVMVVFGGLVRLTHSGLSMVEWHLVTGIVPPISEAGWTQAFEKYAQTPEFKHINSHMSLQEFKSIYYMEYAHRMLGRLTGLVYWVPFLIFWIQGRLRRRDVLWLLGLGILLGFQGLFGWFMVQSGLVDVPQVSHFRLTGHLMLALLFLGACLWQGLSWLDRGRPAPAASVSARAVRVNNLFLGLLFLQITLGGMVAGLHAGVISSTFPKMSGQWLPDIAWSLSPWYANFVNNPVMLHFLHRWNGILVLVAGSWAFLSLRRESAAASVRKFAHIVAELLVFQVLLGIATVLLLVPVPLASLHQTLALAIFIVSLIAAHRLHSLRRVAT